MTIATDFTRDGCRLGKRRVTYAKLQREYRCNDCTGRLVLKWSDACESYPDFWYVECRGCGGHDFIHERELQRQVWEAQEVLAGLPRRMAEALGYSKSPSRLPGEIFSLCPPEPIEI